MLSPEVEGLRRPSPLNSFSAVESQDLGKVEASARYSLMESGSGARSWGSL
jgi:hypothetical protein